MNPPADLIERTKQRIHREPEFANLLAAIIEAPARSAGRYTRTSSEALNRQRLDDALGEFTADALPTAKVQELLGLGTPQAVHQMRRRNKVIGLQSGNGTWFPSWQFEPGRVRPDLPIILVHLARFTSDPVAADRVMRLRRDELDGHALIDALARPHLAPTAWAILGALGT